MFVSHTHTHRVGPQGPNSAALPVLWEKRPRTQLHAVQALLLHFLCTRVRPDFTDLKAEEKLYHMTLRRCFSKKQCSVCLWVLVLSQQQQQCWQDVVQRQTGVKCSYECESSRQNKEISPHFLSLLLSVSLCASLSGLTFV